jgi:hypothetical protein
MLRSTIWSARCSSALAGARRDSLIGRVRREIYRAASARAFRLLGFRVLCLAACLALPCIALSQSSDCVLQAGTMLCAKATPNQWRYGTGIALCASYCSFAAIDCDIAGGTLKGDCYKGFICEGGKDLTPHSEADMVSYAQEFSRRWGGWCGVGAASSIDWPGPGGTWLDECGYPRSPRFEWGYEVSNGTRYTVSGMLPDGNGNCTVPVGSNWIASRQREVKCPTGYSQRQAPDGSLECYRYRDAGICKVSTTGEAHESRVGNPIVVGSGAKEEIETDYVAAGISPLRVTRTYSTMGAFRPYASDTD